MESGQPNLVNDYTEIVRRLPISLKLAYGVGHVLNDICASMWFTYLIVFFHFVLGFNAILSGVVLLIGQIADAVATPFVGYHCDKNDDFWLCKYGRRKTWHILGTFCVLFAFPFIFSRCIECETAHDWAQLIYYAAFVTIFQFGWAAVQISHLALVPELTPNEYERTVLIAIRYCFTVLSNILVYSITWAVLHVTSNDASTSQIGPKDAEKFERIVYIVLCIGVATSIIFHVFVREGAINNNSNGSLRRNTRSVSVLLRDVQLYQVACIYTSTRLFLNLSQIYVPMYIHESLNMPAIFLAIIPLIIFLNSFVVTLLADKLNQKLGKKVMYFLGVLLAIFACIWIQFGTGNSYVKYQIYPVSILLGSAGSILIVTSLSVTADLIGQNTDSGAFVYGIMSFSDKLCNGLAVITIQYLRDPIGGNDYYRNVLTYVCGGAAIVGLLMILYIKPFVYNNAYSSLQSDQIVEHNNTSITAISPEDELDNTLGQELVT